ncbi:MAG: transglycosylase SLT domain-containing protein [Sinobacteraceae bacterium]|nr:transglycosylase SLT domain-containing protein [Nevskiaceae bacterium]
MRDHLAWGRSVSEDFRLLVFQIAEALGIQPDWLMACMAFETGATFSPAIRNAAGSGAVGLIQFMPQTAAALGTTIEALAAMGPCQQLIYVERYFLPRAGKLRNLGDVYMAILWPAGIGRPDDAVLFDRDDPAHPKLYLQNRGLDFNRDGKITRGECVARVQSYLDRGLSPEHCWRP